VGIFQNLKAKRRQKVVLRATKNPLRPRNKLSHAPDAVSREYRGKMLPRKEYFPRSIVIASEPEEESKFRSNMLKTTLPAASAVVKVWR
jgi:hypothetical protein